MISSLMVWYRKLCQHGPNQNLRLLMNNTVPGVLMGVLETDLHESSRLLVYRL